MPTSRPWYIGLLRSRAYLRRSPPRGPPPASVCERQWTPTIATLWSESSQSVHRLKRTPSALSWRTYAETAESSSSALPGGHPSIGMESPSDKWSTGQYGIGMRIGKGCGSRFSVSPRCGQSRRCALTSASPRWRRCAGRGWFVGHLRVSVIRSDPSRVLLTTRCTPSGRSSIAVSVRRGCR